VCEAASEENVVSIEHITDGDFAGLRGRNGSDRNIDLESEANTRGNSKGQQGSPVD
jgi:hypothetical protein